MSDVTRNVGELLRAWRQRRRLSQMDLALESDISARHLSFLETGRALPSRDTLLRLADRLDVPLRERNGLLLAAGYAPQFRERPLAHPEMQAARDAIDQFLAAHAPYPALAIDRRWNLIAANKAAQRLMAGCAESLLQPPLNVLRLSLHPQGLAPRIANLPEWRAHLLQRLQREIEISDDPDLSALQAELRGYDAPLPPPTSGGHGVILPLRLRHGEAVLSLLGTMTVFGTPTEVTLSELALETFFPADAPTAAALRSMSLSA